MSRVVLAATAALLLVAASSPATPPQVDVTGGRVEGAVADDGSLLFRGIPFAAPPTGDLRWKAPQPVRSWRGVRAAKAMAPSCPQNDHGWNKADAARASEDCLTLDIRTPSLRGKRPVMVWIHGGSNRAGSAGGTVDSRITQRGVVLVALQYRLGLLGFLSHRDAAVGGTAGNYGLMDQIAALRWIQDNIARFGGDPRNVTLFGESAGSQDVSLMLAAPDAEKLFDRAIMQSGTPGFGQPFRSLLDAFALGDQAQRLAKVDGIAALRELAVARLLEIDGKLHDPSLHADDFMWLKTTVDGKVLPRSPRELLLKARRRPVIVGSNRVEFGPPANSGALPQMLLHAYGDQAAKAEQLYDFNSPRRDPRLGHPELEIMTDWVFRCPAEELATLLARTGWPVWRYEFDLAQDGKLTSHGAEISYIMDGRPIAHGRSLQDYWVSFARTGNPNSKGAPVWPAYQASSARYLSISASGFVALSKLRADLCSLRNEI